MDEYIDENGDIKFRLLKNQFNFTERESMTYNCLTKVRLIIFFRNNFKIKDTNRKIIIFYEIYPYVTTYDMIVSIYLQYQYRY